MDRRTEVRGVEGIGWAGCGHEVFEGSDGGVDGVREIDGGDEADVGVCRVLAEGDRFAGFGLREPDEEGVEREVVLLCDGGEGVVRRGEVAQERGGEVLRDRGARERGIIALESDACGESCRGVCDHEATVQGLAMEASGWCENRVLH